MKYKLITVILKCVILILSFITVSYFYSSNVQLFNENIVKYSHRFLIGKYIIFLMILHVFLESVSTVNMFSHYATKYLFLNYLLGVISIIISLPLFYNFVDDYEYYSGNVNPLSFVFPLLYLVSGIFDFLIAGKVPSDQV